MSDLHMIHCIISGNCLELSKVLRTKVAVNLAVPKLSVGKPMICTNVRNWKMLEKCTPRYCKAYTWWFTLIECVFLFHLSTVYGHLSATSKKAIDKVINLAGYLGDCEFDSLSTIHNRVMKTRCLRLVASDQDNPVFTFDQLPSGRYKTIKSQVNLRSNCFRVCCARKLNSILF